MVLNWGQVLVPTQGICITISLSSSAELEPPPRWGMVTLGRRQDSWSTTLLPHQQPIRRKLYILQSSPQILPSFSGPSDDYHVQFSSVAQSCPTLCDPMNRSTLGLPVHHQLLELTQTHVHRVGDAIQPSHPLLSPSPPAPNPSQHQSLFQ